MSDIIEQIASVCGIANDYIDAAGQHVTIAREHKIECLKALGYKVDDEVSLAAKFNEEQDLLFTSGAEPVYVINENKNIEITLRVTENEANNVISYTVKLEDGSETKGEFKLDLATRLNSRNVNGKEYIEYKTNIENRFPLGYHDIQFSTVERTLSDIRLIVTPVSCYKPQAIRDGKKVWGPSVQLYTLRSSNNWGVGDFSDLRALIIKLSENGAGFVGINPIHAAYPSNPDSASPYSPSSRRWLNVIYINVEDTYEYRESRDIRADVNTRTFQKKLADLRNLEYVDYKAVMDLKLPILKRLYDSSTIKDGRSNRGKAYKKFVTEGGESLLQMATYDAMMNSFYLEGKNAWGWPVWDPMYRKYNLPFVKIWQESHEEEINFFMYLQFLADEQLELAHQEAKKRGMTVGIYRDLAVGVSSGSEEIWANGDVYCTKASVGAPPDPLGPLGQNWGLPPMSPRKLVEYKYQPIVELFRSNMQHCGSLRIDHAMSLLRLWWVPPEASAKNGVYVYYRVHDLVGILALESHRNECLIIGEDLGTVPDEMKSILKDAGIHSYKIFFWEKAQDGGFISPKDYVEQAMSALSTHDMPTIVGWWNHSDLELGKSLGLYTDENVKNIGDARYADQSRILDSLHWHKVIPDNVPYDGRNCPITKELSEGMQIHMCKGSCALFSTQIEDWLGMDKPVNVPGTSSEYPNWRRKLSKNIDDIFNDKDIIELLRKMTLAREEVSSK
ncbi:MAG: 4-alpha-glucanotransferase [Succinivibrionaceae bacterium]